MALSRKCHVSLVAGASLPLPATMRRLHHGKSVRACRVKHKHSRARRGASAVEFSLVAPVFFLVIFGFIENGRMLMLQHALTNAAREGCRTAGLASSVEASNVESAVRDHLKPTLGNTASDTSKVRVTVPGTLTDVSSQTDLTVTVEVDYADASWLPFEYLGANPVIGAEARRKRE